MIDGRRLRRIRKRASFLRDLASQLGDSNSDLAARLDQAADDQEHLFSILRFACGRIEQLESAPGSLGPVPLAPLRSPSVLREVPLPAPPYQEVESEERQQRLNEAGELIEQASEIRQVLGLESETEYQVIRGDKLKP